MILGMIRPFSEIPMMFTKFCGVLRGNLVIMDEIHRLPSCIPRCWAVEISRDASDEHRDETRELAPHFGAIFIGIRFTSFFWFPNFENDDRLWGVGVQSHD
jgi:hypothetical protein